MDIDRTHQIDAYIEPLASHRLDAYIIGLDESFVQLSANTNFPIVDPNYVRLLATILDLQRDFVLLAATVEAADRGFVNLAGILLADERQYVRLDASILNGGSEYVRLLAALVAGDVDFVKLAATLVQPVSKDSCGNFPDQSYVKLAAWIVSPPPNDSLELPGEQALSDDFNSHQIAQALYHPVSRVKLDGISLIVTGFTSGIVSFQTRTRQWLRRVDAAPDGLVVSTETNIRTLTNGQTITTTTERKLERDKETTTISTVNSSTPERTTVQVIEKSRSGKTVKRTTDIQRTLGVQNSVEKKTVTSSPSTKDNIQPIQVRTLDGVQHYQWFSAVNPDWSTGDEEGTTTIERSEQIIPGVLNGQTVDAFGNPILVKITDEKVSKPLGQIINTHTEVVGVKREGGTTVTDEESTFDGLKTTVKKITYSPDGSSSVEESVTDNQSGDSVEVTTDVVTDEFGQVVTTVSTLVTVTVFDSVLGKNRTTETRTTKVTKSGVSTTEVTVLTKGDFEDDIITKKIKVFFVQEFTITCLIDRFNMQALLGRHIQHQTQYARVELFGQQLGNANLTWELRQKLIEQFEEAVNCLGPMVLEALGNIYEVVFAPSASAFRAKYVVGTQPHAYELQLILQQRSDLVTGARNF